MFVLVLPKVSVMIAGRAVEVPSVDEINSRKNSFSKQTSKEFLNQLGNFKVSGNKVESGTNTMVEFQKYMEKISDEREEKTRTFNEKLNLERRNKQDIQEDLTFAISRVSPSACFSFAISNFAGTSLGLLRNYRNQAENYQMVFAKFQKDKTGGTTGGAMTFIVRNGGDDKPPEVKPSELPKYQFQPESLAKSFSASFIDISLLLFFNLFFFGASYIRFLKFDLR